MTVFDYKGWSEIQKFEIPPSELCPISGDWGKLGILNLTRIFLMKLYWMLQNSRVTAFTFLSYQGKINTRRGVKLPPPRLGLIILGLEGYISWLVFYCLFVSFFVLFVCFSQKFLILFLNCFNIFKRFWFNGLWYVNVILTLLMHNVPK